MSHQRLAMIFTAASLFFGSLPAYADASADEAAIRERFRTWTAAFNARDAAGVCDLFAPDLIYSVPEITDGTQQTMCSNIAKIFAKTGLELRYDGPDIHEIIMKGDIAIVRLTWTLTTKTADGTDTTEEEGMDIFRRQPDGRWSIARFIAFTTRANEMLK
ncbi:YybH family protein [Kaistia algarum]|uniref:YybH family protein n=1 Tax=Kaistia algarum TaxID=2083279 RepID=UPI0014033729|nr:nuclear transport factor 2 family protein [Kaistia algarum]MCX5514536.1 nuclear transport factor 2 family protein [Kaistia algarum]